MDILQERGLPVRNESGPSTGSFVAKVLCVCFLSTLEVGISCQSCVIDCHLEQTSVHRNEYAINILSDLGKAIMGECDVDAGEWDQSRLTLLLVIIDGLAIFQDLGNSLDVRHKPDKFVSETLYIGDLKEEVSLCLLGKAAPVSITRQSHS